MIERSGEYAFEHALHGGQGSMTMQWYFFEESRLPVAVQTWELPPGASEGLHSHDPDSDPLDELYLVLAGSARMHVDDAVHELAPGDSVLAQAGVAHDLINTGSDTLRVLVVWASRTQLTGRDSVPRRAPKEHASPPHKHMAAAGPTGIITARQYDRR